MQALTANSLTFHMYKHKVIASKRKHNDFIADTVHNLQEGASGCLPVVC